MISLIMPVYKEAENIENTARKIVKVLRDHKVTFEMLIIVDEAPNDETADIAVFLMKKFKEIRLVKRKGKRGVGRAIREGIEMSNGKIIIPIMADSSENPMDIVKLSKKIQDHEIAVGNRFTEKSVLTDYPFFKYIVNRCYYYLVKILFGFPSNDVTNAFKAYKAEILKNLKLESNGFEIFVEIPLKAYLGGHKRIIDVPVGYYGRKKGAPKLILMKDGWKYLKILVKIFRCRVVNATGVPSAN